VGYLLKNMTPEDLVLSLQAVMRGATLFAKTVTEKIVRTQEGELGAQDDIMERLTPRERDVLNLVMRLMNNRQIADALGISERSVRNYIHSLYDAFDVGDRMELIQKLKETWPLARPGWGHGRVLLRRRGCDKSTGYSLSLMPFVTLQLPAPPAQCRCAGFR
jgi:DNA-binding NarL/FixJ family response regulator